MDPEAGGHCGTTLASGVTGGNPGLRTHFKSYFPFSDPGEKSGREGLFLRLECCLDVYSLAFVCVPPRWSAINNI